jgi:acyl-CoA thioester hydrolase
MDLRVRLDETDALGVVYYGRYLAYFDISRLEMLREAGITLPYLRKRRLGFVAAQASCKYVESAKLDEKLTLKVKVARIGSASITYSHEIKRGRAMIALGSVTDVMVGGTGRPTKIPIDMREKLSRYR